VAAVTDIFQYGLLNPNIRLLLDPRSNPLIGGGLGTAPPFGMNAATRLINRDGGRNVSDGPTHGNWCGQYWSGGTYAPPGTPDGPFDPIDSMDAKCMKHDFCYEDASNDPDAKRICDRNLIEDLDNLPDSPKDWPMPPPPGTELGTRAYRSGAKIWFGS
jgi:hypothetical protein